VAEETDTPPATIPESGPPPSKLIKVNQSDMAARPGFRDPANGRSKAQKKRKGKKARR
jgi:hypothetical protein